MNDSSKLDDHLWEAKNRLIGVMDSAKGLLITGSIGVQRAQAVALVALLRETIGQAERLVEMINEYERNSEP